MWPLRLLTFAMALWCTGCALLPGEYSHVSASGFITDIPASIDQVQIEAVTVDHKNSGKLNVVDTKVLSGTNATAFLNLWKTLPYDSQVTECLPEPGYRISFWHRGGGRVFSAEICFLCGNVRFTSVPGDAETLCETHFDENDARAKALRRYLARLFPSHDPSAFH